MGIVILENDKKVLFQIQQLVKELGGDIQVANYPSSKEFEESFAAVQKETKPFELNPILKTLNEDERGFLVTGEWHDQALAQVACVFKPELDVIESYLPDSPQFFGFEKKDICGIRLAFGNLIPPLFRTRWTNAVAEFTAKRSATLVTALQMHSKKVLLVEIILSFDGQNRPQMVIRDQRAKVYSAIEAERKRLKDLEDKEKEVRPFTTIDIVYFRPQVVQGDTVAWVERMFNLFKKYNYHPENYRTRFVVLKYEDDGISKMKYVHRFIDDVIHLPLDRLLFLQKADLLLNLPKKVSPRFLFQQAVQDTIEICKQARIEKISDVGLAISNPLPLREGTLGNFYLQLPNESDAIQVFGKVVKSVRNEADNNFYVYFSYILQTRNQAMQLRKFIGTKPNHRPLVRDDERLFKFDPDNLFNAEEDKRLKTVVVLGADDSQAEQIKKMIETDFDSVRVICLSSLAHFLQFYLGQQSLTHSERLRNSRVATAEDLPADQFCVYLQPENKVVTRFSEEPLDKTCLGHLPASWTGNDGFLQAFFPEPDLLEKFQEALTLAYQGTPVKKLFLCRHADGKYRALSIEVKLGPDGIFQVELRPPSNDDFQKYLLSSEALDGLDALIIDSVFVPDSVDSFVTGVENAARAKGLVKDNINIIVTVDEHRAKRMNAKLFQNPSIRSVLIRPYENRAFGFALSCWARSRYTKYNFENINWLDVRLSCQMATDILIEEISEFGATLRHSRPIAPGAVLFLRKSIFDSSPEKFISARFYLCQEHATEKGQFTCAVTYFGINDTFAKFARNYFRESYALAKAKEAGA